MFQLHNVHTKELECREVIPIIAKAGQSIDMVLSRNPLADLDDDQHAPEQGTRGEMWEGHMEGFAEETV